MRKKRKPFTTRELNADDFQPMADFLKLLAAKFKILDERSMVFETSYIKTKDGVNEYAGGRISGEIR